MPNLITCLRWIRVFEWRVFKPGRQEHILDYVLKLR